MPVNLDDNDQGSYRNRKAQVNPLAELLAILPPEARRVLRNVAEETAHAALRAGGGPNPLAAAATTATRLLSEVARQRMEADTPASGPTRSQGGPGSVQTTSPERAAARSFARLPQPGTDWWQFVRCEAVVAIKSPSVDRCVVMLADGRELEVGGSSDAAAQEISGLVRLTQPGTQRCMYIRPSAVVAVTAPSQGCVLHLCNGRELEAGEAAAVAADLIARVG
jgi:hypothetical protein